MGAAAAAFFASGGGGRTQAPTKSQTQSQPIPPADQCDGLLILGGIVLGAFILSALLIWIAARFVKR